MTVEVFISWSGEQSRCMARALNKWIPSILQGTTVFFSEEAIKPGTFWSSELAQKLDSSDFGIFVVTPSNLRSRWLNFEAGAIAKRLQGSHAIPLLVGLHKEDLNGPLAEFQTVEWSRSGVLNMLYEIGGAVGSKLHKPELEALFNGVWPEFEREVAQLPGPFSESSPLRFLLGDNGRGDPVSLVFPRFTLDPKLSETLNEPDQLRVQNILQELHSIVGDKTFSLLFGKPGQRKGGEGLDDIRPFAMNDLRALCRVAEELSKEGARCKPVPDEDIHRVGNGSPAVLFGLTTNSMTKSYIESSNLAEGPEFGRLGGINGTDWRPLFKEVGDGQGREVQLINNIKLSYRNDEYGLIARVTPPNHDSSTKWLICAGLGPTGTEAAANYLCQKGRSIASTVGSRDFVQVVRCKSGRPDLFYSDESRIVYARDNPEV